MKRDRVEMVGVLGEFINERFKLLLARLFEEPRIINFYAAYFVQAEEIREAEER